MRDIIHSTQWMCHGVNNAEAYVGESHTCNILTKRHSFTTCEVTSHGATQGATDNFNSFQMKHIRKFPCTFCNITFHGMNEGIHPGRRTKTSWHRCGHIRVHDGYDWNIMRVNTYKFTVLFNICNNVVNSNLCSRTRCGRHSNNRQAWMFRRCHPFKATHIAELRVRHNRSNSLTCIDSTATAYSNDSFSTCSLTSSHTRCYVFNGWIRLNIVIDIISNTCRIKKICYLCSHLKLK